MAKAYRLEASIVARRNLSRDAAPAIQCRAVERKMHRTVPALVSNEIPNHRGARQHYLRTRLLPHPSIPEINASGGELSQRATRAEDSLAE